MRKVSGNNSPASTASISARDKDAKSLYVHVPFCERKCGYCSFYSVTGREYVSSWLEAVSREAESYSRHGRVSVSTLYIGGGTPTVLTLTEWETLMGIIRRNFDTSAITEATCEANPSSLTPEHVAFLKANNFTRISLGVQSLNDSELLTLGRLHDSRSALAAMNTVKSSGLELSCDLIFAIPLAAFDDGVCGSCLVLSAYVRA